MVEGGQQHLDESLELLKVTRFASDILDVLLSELADEAAIQGQCGVWGERGGGGREEGRVRTQTVTENASTQHAPPWR